MAKKTINILGVTGSIGSSACDVILANPDYFDVNVITAHTSKDSLDECAVKLGAKQTILSAEQDILPALEESVDVTLCAVMGMAGLPSMLKAIQNSKMVLIANKEPLVAAGPLVLAEAKKNGTKLLPVDSEHNAIFQVFDENQRDNIERIILTASGGPFREWSLEQMRTATPEQALAHPNWDMGRKISIDSATMMNKALEVIEAHYLFDIEPENIEVVIHPQSIVHSMVEYNDGSILAQMGANDMRTPLANILNWPARIKTPGNRLDFKALKELNFETPDFERFPALKLAYEALDRGSSACIAMNASNEVAVDAFLNNSLGFLDIVETVKHIMGATETKTLDTLENILDFDANIREATRNYLQLS